MLLAIDAAGTLALLMSAGGAGRRTRAPLLAISSISAIGVATAAPRLLRAMGRGTRQDASAALRTVRLGLAFHTLGSIATLLIPHKDPRASVVVAVALVGGDAITWGYERELQRLTQR